MLNLQSIRNHENHEKTRKFNDLETTDHTNYTEMLRRLADCRQRRCLWLMANGLWLNTLIFWL